MNCTYKSWYLFRKFFVTLLLVVGYINSGFSQANINDGYMYIGGNAMKFASTTGYYSGTLFNNYNFGNQTNFYITELQGFTWKNDNGAGGVYGNVCAVTFYYKVYKSGDDPTSVSFTSVSLGWKQNYDSYNQRWGETNPPININLLSGLELGSTYTLETYFSASVNTTSGGSCTETSYLSNGGSNYKATFTYGNVYWWIGGNGSTAHSWNTTSYWSTSRGGSAVGSLTFGSNTVFIFDGSCMNTGCSINSGTITLDKSAAGNISAAKILLKNSASVIYNVSTTITPNITLSGGVGTDFDIPSGSSWTSLNSAHTITLNAGTTAAVFGQFNIGTASVVSSGASKLIATDANSVTFYSGSSCTLNYSANNYPFGTTSADGSVIFNSGSTLYQVRSADIFGGNGKTIITFQTGSNYEFIGSSSANVNFVQTTDVASRTYSNIIINHTNASTQTFQNFASDVVCDSFILKSTCAGSATFANYNRTLTIKGNLSNNTTNKILSFSPNNNGTAVINFSGTSSQYIYNNGASASINFGNTTASRVVQINVNSGATVIMGDAVTSGSFTLTSVIGTSSNALFTVKNGGILDMASSVIYGAGATTGGSFATESGSTVKTKHVQGLSTTASTGAVQTQTRTYHSGASYVFNGTSAQVTGNFLASTTPSANTVNNLTIDNTAGVTIPASTGNVTVNGVLYLTNGVFNTRTNSVYAIVSGTNATTSVQRTNGWVSGNLTRGIATSGSDYVFYVGDDATNYTPATVNFTGISTPGTLNVITYNSDHTQIATSDILKEADANRYWTFTKTAIVATSYSARLDYVSADRDAAATDPTIFKAGLYSSSTWSYPTVSSAAAYYVQTSGNTLYGDFVVGYKCGNSTIKVWLGTVDDNWNVAGNWQCGIPDATSNVIIPNTTNKPRIYAANAVAQSILIAASGKLIMEGVYNLTLSSGATFTNNAAAAGFDASASTTGALIFLGSGTITGTQTFNNVEYYGGLNFGTSSTVSGTVTIQTGGYTDINAPTYSTNSTLKYNVGSGGYMRRVEWSTTSGNGYPYNVVISNSSKIWAAHASSLPANTAMQIGGSLTIESGSTLYLNSNSGSLSMTVPMIVAGSINLQGTLVASTTSGADVKLAADWNLYSTGLFTANSRAVYFTGSALQNIWRQTSGVIIFPYVINQNTSGGIKLSTNVTYIYFNAASGDVLQMLGSGTGNVLDLNGKNADINNGGSIKISGTPVITSNGGASNFYISGGSGTGNVNGTGALEFGTNITFQLGNGFSFGNTLSTIKGTLSVNASGFVNLYAPTYYTGSLLRYNSSGPYDRNVEWGAGSGPGYPYHVEVRNGTTLNLYANGGAAQSCAGNLTLGVTGSTGSLTMGTMTNTLTVGGNVVIGGTTGTSTLTLGSISGANAGDIYVGGSWTRNAYGVFNPGTGTGRAVFFNSSTSPVTITASNGETFPFLFINKTAKANTVTLNDSIIITSELHLTKGTFDLSNSDAIIRSTSSSTACITPVGASTDLALSYNTGRFKIERYLPMDVTGNYTSRRWRLMGIPVSSDAAPTINAAWQEGATPMPFTTAYTSGPSVYDPAPGFGTRITNGYTAAAVTAGYDLGTTGNPSIYYYNGSTYGVPSTSDVITTRNAYMLFVRGNRTVQITDEYQPTSGGAKLRIRGKINTGNVSPAVPTGYYWFSNPYASAVNMRTVSYNGTGSTNTYYLWDPKLLGSKNVGGWVTFSWNGSSAYNNSYDFVPNSGTGMSSYPSDGTIESGMAFMLNNTTGSATSITFTESSKVTGSTTVGIASRPAPGSQARPKNYATLYTNLLYRDARENTFLADGVLTGYGNGLSDDLDEMDVAKAQIFQTKEKIGLLRNDSLLCIERRHTIMQEDTIFLQLIKLDKNYKYQLEFTGNSFAPNLDAFLVDHYLNTNYPVNTEGTTSYNFETTGNPATMDVNRFMVVFKLRQGAPLPVRFVDVRATELENDKAILISWKAEGETNTQEYQIERSLDGIHFVFAGVTTAAGQGAYSWTDRNLHEGMNYYRIVSIENSGEKLYSNVVYVNISGSMQSSIAVFPNPVKDGRVYLQMNHVVSGKYHFRLSNDIGQTLLRKEMTIESGTAGIDLYTVRSKGVYQLTVTRPDNSVVTIKLVY